MLVARKNGFGIDQVFDDEAGEFVGRPCVDRRDAVRLAASLEARRAPNPPAWDDPDTVITLTTLGFGVMLGM